MYNTTEEWQSKNTMFEIRWFNDQAELYAYIGSASYEGPDSGICFAFEISESGDDTYDVQLYFQDWQLYGGFLEAGIPSLFLNAAPEV